MKNLSLSKIEILELINNEYVSAIKSFEIFSSIDSTNDYLKNKDDLVSGEICIADQQTHGRGRNGKSWSSPPGGNIYMSISCGFSKDNFPYGLSLAVGLSLIKALERFKIFGVKLKWPNDLYFQDKKFAGILIDLIQQGSKTMAIIGVGLNVINAEYENLECPITSLNQIIDSEFNRSFLTAAIINQLLSNLNDFKKYGFEHFSHDWNQYNYLLHKEVSITIDEERLQGVIEGVDKIGQLIFRVDGKEKLVNSGIIKLI